MLHFTITVYHFISLILAMKHCKSFFCHVKCYFSIVKIYLYFHIVKYIHISFGLVFYIRHMSYYSYLRRLKLLLNYSIIK